MPHNPLEEFIIEVIIHGVSPLEVLIERVRIVPVGKRHGCSLSENEYPGGCQDFERHYKLGNAQCKQCLQFLINFNCLLIPGLRKFI